MAVTDIEEENLSAHVLACTLRFEQINARLDSVNESFAEIKTDNKEMKKSVDDLKDLIQTVNTKQTEKSSKASWWLNTAFIGAGLSFFGYFVLKFIHP